jgi:glycosyltransferase involved in cell wall biosynthesis
MKLLVVSTWPPMPCGIGKYAEQQVAALRRERHLVDTLSPPEGDGDFQEVLHGGLRPLRLLKYLWAYDQVWLHYTQHFFFDPARWFDRLLTSFAFLMLMLLAGRRFTIIVHETDCPIDRPEPSGPRRRLDRWWWRLTGRLVFHSVRERDAFCAFYRLSPERRSLEIWPHERFFERRCALDRADARRRLGIHADVTLLVCLGFIQPHKGFDRVIEALRRVPDAPRLCLKIVGSVRLPWDRAHAYARELHELAERDPRVEVIETWLSDEMFDVWIVAADYVVLPYRQIWSSGVAARARLYGRPLLAADIGALGEQLTPGSLLFKSDEELDERLAEIAGRGQKTKAADA